MEEYLYLIRGPVTELRPHINNHFPYSFGKFSSMKHWVESRPRMGQRVVSQAWNPFLKKWTDRKVSAYHDLAFIVFDPLNGLAEGLVINFKNLTDQQLIDLATYYPLDDEQKARLFQYTQSLTQKVFITNWATYTPDASGFHPVPRILPDAEYTTTRQNANTMVREGRTNPIPTQTMETTQAFTSTSETMGKGYLQWVTTMDASIKKSWDDRVTKLGAANALASIKDEAALWNKRRLQTLESHRQTLIDTINNPVPERVAVLPCPWDEWCIREKADFAKFEQELNNGIFDRDAYVQWLEQQV